VWLRLRFLYLSSHVSSYPRETAVIAGPRRPPMSLSRLSSTCTRPSTGHILHMSYRWAPEVLYTKKTYLLTLYRDNLPPMISGRHWPMPSISQTTATPASSGDALLPNISCTYWHNGWQDSNMWKQGGNGPRRRLSHWHINIDETAYSLRAAEYGSKRATISSRGHKVAGRCYDSGEARDRLVVISYSDQCFDNGTGVEVITATATERKEVRETYLLLFLDVLTSVGEGFRPPLMIAGQTDHWKMTTKQRLANSQRAAKLLPLPIRSSIATFPRPELHVQELCRCGSIVVGDKVRDKCSTCSCIAFHAMPATCLPVMKPRTKSPHETLKVSLIAPILLSLRRIARATVGGSLEDQSQCD